MRWLFIALLYFATSLQAKPIIDLRDTNITPQHSLSYERPNFTFMTRGKNSHVIVLTDHCLKDAQAYRRQGYEKIVAYMMEPKAISGWMYPFIEARLDQFDLVLTYDKYLLDKYPAKCKFIHAAGYGCLYDYRIHPKSKMCSIMTGKNFAEGHKLRHAVLDRYRDYFDGIKEYGKSAFATWKDPWLNDFRFAVIIENSKQPHYFSEKLTDCLCAGTVPIYWGCPTISEFFDMDGIIVFNSLEELGPILQNLSVEEYNKRLPAIQRNFAIAAKYPQHSLSHRPHYPDCMDVIWPYLEPFFQK